MSHHIYAVIGPSGVGKTTLTNAIFPEANRIVSFTSREPRPGEQEGKDYYFIDKQSESQIDTLIEKCKTGELVELVKYNNNVYGYTKAEIDKKFNEEQYDAVAVVTLEGYFNLIHAGLDKYVVPVFIAASRETVARHLANRNDTPENIEKRLSLFDEEIKNIDVFNKITTDKILLNNDSDDLSKNVDYLKSEIERINKKKG